MSSESAGAISARTQARAVLGSLGFSLAPPDHPAGRLPEPLAWARSGAMALTGAGDGPPVPLAVPLATAAAGALLAAAALAESDALLRLDGAALLGERAAIAGLSRRGRTSPGGASRLLRAADGWLALTLAREEDVAALEAWLGQGPPHEPWTYVRAGIRRRCLAPLLERARLLGLPAAAAAAAPGGRAPAWLRVAARGTPVRRDRCRPPLVVDLSSLWAGPLCSSLLARCGARVVKVESARRPDGARRGPRAFFDLLHAGAECVALDLSDPRERGRLAALVSRADVVLEGSRPRALVQLGIDAEACVRARPGQVWLSLTAYGRAGPAAHWVGFGDDVACAGGLARVAKGAAPRPCFCADAVADPLAGIHGAAAVLAALRAGGGVLLDLSLAAVAAHVARQSAGVAGVLEAVPGGGHRVRLDGACQRVEPPRARAARAPARGLGADNARVLAELAPAC